MLTESPDPPYLLPQTRSNVLHLRRLQSDLGGLLGTRSANSVARSTLRRTSSSRRIRTFTLGLALWKDRPPRSEDVLAGCHPSACVEEGMRGDVGGRVWDVRKEVQATWLYREGEEGPSMGHRASEGERLIIYFVGGGYVCVPICFSRPRAPSQQRNLTQGFTSAQQERHVSHWTLPV
jgi:hypothetical protein